MSIAHALAKGWAQSRLRQRSRVGARHDGGFVILPAGHPAQHATKGVGRTWIGSDGVPLVVVRANVLVSQEEAAFIDKRGVNTVVRAALTAFFYEGSNER